MSEPGPLQVSPAPAPRLWPEQISSLSDVEEGRAEGSGAGQDAVRGEGNPSDRGLQGVCSPLGAPVGEKGRALECVSKDVTSPREKLGEEGTSFRC